MLTPVRTTSIAPATAPATDGATTVPSAGAGASPASPSATGTGSPASSTTGTAAAASASAAGNTSSADDTQASPVSGGRLGLLSLSGQLQMAQGVSAIADAIGQALQMPRGDSEGLQDYAARLASAVSAMTTAERTDLEATINQSVSGTSLRVLAELLRNPAGPDAARLTAYLEAALMDGADPDQVMRTVLTAYQQNGATDGAPLPRQVLAGAAGAMPSAQTSMPGAFPAASGTAMPGVGSAAILATTPGDGDGQATIADALTLTARATSGSDGRQGMPAANSGQQGAPMAGTANRTATAVAAGSAASTGTSTASSTASSTLAQPITAAALTAMPDGQTGTGMELESAKPTAGAVAGRDNQAQMHGGTRNDSVLSGTGGTGRAPSQGQSNASAAVPSAAQYPDDLVDGIDHVGRADSVFSGRAVIGTNLSQLLATRPDTLATIEWLATALAGNALPGLIAALAAQEKNSAVDDFIARLIAGGLVMGSSDIGHLMAQARAMAAPPDPQTTGSIADDPDLPQIPTDTRPHTAAPARKEGDGLPLPLAAQMQAAQAREGFVFPYVTYPPLDQPPQRRPRRPTIEIAAVDEDGEHPQQPGEQAFDDDGNEPDGEDGDAGGNAGEGNGEGPGASAVNAFGTAGAVAATADQTGPPTEHEPGTGSKPSGKREAPTAHLANGADTDGDLPQDLYFRMAGWK